MRDEIDTKDLMILKRFHQGNNVSIRELMDLVLIRSTATMRYRLDKLEELGLLVPPPTKGMHRSRKISEKGIEVLRQQRLINAK